MPSLQNIRRRIGSVKNTQKITRAMKLVSGAKLRRAQERMTAARPYAQEMQKLLEGLAGQVRGHRDPLMETRPEKKSEIVVVAADRGLCGSFNTNVVRRAMEIIREKEQQGVEVSLTVVGRKSHDFFRRRPSPIRKSWTQFFDRLRFDHATQIADDLREVFLAGVFDTCELIFSEFHTVSSSQVRVQRLLPVGGDAPDPGPGTAAGYLYEPQEEEIFARLLPRNLQVQIFRALLESYASEQAARMLAMDAATRNAQEMIQSLTLVFNKTRQAAITSELMDIIGGSEALN